VNISSSTSKTALSVKKQGKDDSHTLQQQQQQLRTHQQHASTNSATNNRSKSNLYFANFNNNVNKEG
jgi:hypothetical protein